MTASATDLNSNTNATENDREKCESKYLEEKKTCNKNTAYISEDYMPNYNNYVNQKINKKQQHTYTQKTALDPSNAAS